MTYSMILFCSSFLQRKVTVSPQVCWTIKIAEENERSTNIVNYFTRLLMRVVNIGKEIVKEGPFGCRLLCYHDLF